MKRKLLALLTVLALAVSIFSVVAMADEPETPEAPEAPEAVAESAVDLSAFADAADIANAQAVAALVDMGIINGIEKEDGSFVFAPQENITREQMAKMMALAYEKYHGIAVTTGAKTAFTDVSGRWSSDYVAYCAKNGIINGRSEKVFDYAGSVTVTETAKMVMAALGESDLTGESWKTATLAAADKIGLLEGIETGKDEAITRDEAALVLYRFVEQMAANYVPAVQLTEAGEAVTGFMMTNLARMTHFTMRDDSGDIYVGAYIRDGEVNAMSALNITDASSIVFDTVAVGPGYTALYATGEKTNVTVTGKVNITDDTDGQIVSDFTGTGAVIVAEDGATVTVDGMDIYTDGFERDAFITDDEADLIVKASTVVCMGADPLTEAYPEYINSANQAIMLSPPWVLGIQGGVRCANILGDYSSLTVIDSKVSAGGWAVLSTDDCTEPVMNVVDSELVILTEAEGGMSSGDFEYSDKYGSGYGTYSIGYATENFYGVTVKGATYATILRSGYLNFMSSKGTIELKNAKGEVIYTGEGKGNPTVLNTVFGVLTHSGEDAVVYSKDGTVFNTEEAVFLYKTSGTATFNVDDTVINSASKVILQMMDDDDESVGADFSSGSPAFNTSFHEEAGWPSENGSVSGKVGGDKAVLNLTNGTYEGDAYNGTGYYGQGADNMYVTVGEGAVLKGVVALTETQHKVKDFTINEYYYLGQVENRLYWNGISVAEVTVKAGGQWDVTGDSLITKLVVEEGAVVHGTVTVNEDGTLTVSASEEVIAAGTYGTIEAQAAASGGMGGGMGGPGGPGKR